MTCKPWVYPGSLCCARTLQLHVYCHRLKLPNLIDRRICQETRILPFVRPALPVSLHSRYEETPAPRRKSPNRLLARPPEKTFLRGSVERCDSREIEVQPFFRQVIPSPPSFPTVLQMYERGRSEGSRRLRRLYVSTLSPSLLFLLLGWFLINWIQGMWTNTSVSVIWRSSSPALEELQTAS